MRSWIILHPPPEVQTPSPSRTWPPSTQRVPAIAPQPASSSRCRGWDDALTVTLCCLSAPCLEKLFLCCPPDLPRLFLGGPQQALPPSWSLPDAPHYAFSECHSPQLSSCLAGYYLALTSGRWGLLLTFFCLPQPLNEN